MNEPHSESAEPGRAPEGHGRSRTRTILRGMLVPFLALVLALAVGGLVIVFTDPVTLGAWASFFRAPGHALSASWELVYDTYSALFKSSLGSSRALSETVVAATPLILAGLSVALAFRAGLFNIGAEGQLVAGSLAAAWVGFSFDLPAVIHLPLTLFAGFAGGALWGFIPGILKARTGAHEVIITIMLNFIALRLSDYLLNTEVFRRPGRTDPISKPVADSADLPALGDLRIHAGIIVALLMAYVVWWLLFRSTIGFEFRAVGTNPRAAAYAGISVGGTYMVAMVMAGGLAGLGGTANLLGVQGSLAPGFSSGYGFDAIALALLGRANPAGVVLAAFLFGILRAGAVGMQAATQTPVDIIVVIQALVIAFMAAPALVRAIFRIHAERQESADVFTKSWAT